MKLPNACSCTELCIFPADWNEPMASLQKDWYIYYRFTDPLFADRYPDGKLVVFSKGINRSYSVTERRKQVRAAKKKILADLKEGYNPITKRTLPPQLYYNQEVETDSVVPLMAPQITEYHFRPDLIEIGKRLAKETERAQQLKQKPQNVSSLVVLPLAANMQFIEALWGAYRRLPGSTNYKTDLRSVIRMLHIAAFLLRIHQVEIRHITPQHIIFCFEALKVINPRFTNNRRNKVRAYLLAFYKELVIALAAPTNIISGIPILKKVRRKRVLPTDEEILRIDNYLKTKDYYFWRLVRIFYHSGCRETELAKIQYKHVNLERREFTVTVLKGTEPTEETKPISPAAFLLWKEVMAECEELADMARQSYSIGEIYLFSKHRRPQYYSIRSDQFSRRWTRYVKKELGLNIAFYTLKHLNSDRLSAVLSIHHAQMQNSHKSTATTMIYAVSEDARRLEELKKVNIPLLPAASSVPAEMVKTDPYINKISMKSLGEQAIGTLRLFIKLLSSRDQIEVRGNNVFPLFIKRAATPVKTPYGEAVLYTFIQGSRMAKSLVSACQMDLLVTNNFNEVFPCELRMDAIERKEVSVYIADNRVVHVDSVFMAPNCQFAASWLEILVRHYKISSRFGK